MSQTSTPIRCCDLEEALFREATARLISTLRARLAAAVAASVALAVSDAEYKSLVERFKKITGP